MQVSKIHALRVSIYDKAGMIHVNPLSKDFAPTSKGYSSRKAKSAESEAQDLEFEDELNRAMEQQAGLRIDYHA